MDKVMITGCSSGIGLTTSKFFLDKGYYVVGIDRDDCKINHLNFQFIKLDIFKDELIDIDDVAILINNAGLQNSSSDIDNNLKGTMKITEKYAFNSCIKSVLFNISSSSLTGFEFPDYVASKSGLIGYMKNVACRLANYNKATCNGLSFGGVITPLNDSVMNDKEKWNKIMEVTPLKKWMSADECAQWIYFMTVINKSCSGQNILIDNGEKDLNNTFVW